ncbi:MAG: 4Fe-4S dicluster domain-containing protein [Gammaproteobacteria bacterium]|nr:4Fe-4S dicluster domain-containing protein [Gammaproteobacteria bacterium]MDH3535415.1 4Fe-4S dicluster domain-containing protein [Gammaproteobacteria bacterium]
MATNPGKLLQSSRRDFLKGTAAVATILIAPGIFLYKTGQAAAGLEREARWGMLIDTNALSEADVDACVSACQREHGWQTAEGSRTDAQWVRKLRLEEPETGHQKFLPMMCQHCESPPCVDVCPTGASFKRADGIVLVDRHTCIGCRYCMMACPYKARSFIHENLKDQLPVAPRGKGTVESCTMCVHRVDRDGADAVPACAEAVNRNDSKAILFGNLNDPQSEISRRLRELGGTRLRADMGLNPGVRYQGL